MDSELWMRELYVPCWSEEECERRRREGPFILGFGILLCIAYICWFCPRIPRSIQRCAIRMAAFLMRTVCWKGKHSNENLIELKLKDKDAESGPPILRSYFLKKPPPPPSYESERVTYEYEIRANCVYDEDKAKEIFARFEL